MQESDQIVEVLSSTGGRERIVIIRREDGTFRLGHERYYRTIYEGELIAEGRDRLYSDASVFQSDEIAEREARAAYPWLF